MTTPPVQSISDEVLAEIESYASLYGHPQEVEACITFRDLRGLIGRLKAAEVDSRRLDFMIREGCVIESQNGSMSPFVHRLYWRDTAEAQREWSATEREAIDAAMERAK